MASNLKHARLLPPSSSKRWRTCAASAVIMAYGRVVQETPHPNTIRGTLMHGVGEDVLTSWLEGEINACARDYIGRALDGQVFSVIEAKEVQGYIDYVKKRIAEDPDSMVFLEQRLYYCRIVGVPEDDAFGSGDCIIIQPNLGRIIVIDLKTGKWEVEAMYNDQLTIYGMAALRKFRMFAELRTVEMVIYQREAFSWEVSADYMSSYAVALRRDVKKIREAEKAYKAGGIIPAMYFTVGEGCRFCKVVNCEKRNASIWGNRWDNKK